MDCKHASDMMSLRLDGCLADAEISLLESHLAACQTCCEEWRRLQALNSLFTSALLVQPPVRLRVGVMARLERRERARRAVIGGTTLALGTLTLALLALAPTIIGLLNATSVAPTLLSGGPETVVQLLTFLGTLGRALLVLVEKLALPLASLGMCSIVIALALNGLWVGAVRRLRTTT